ncbi:hypothetical protein T484DRAFT_1790004 [Baffinella frigidus]|nr:hypothetical protein T484DRAFT_1790004 [Cryptophyta sp. CCMP2293]
MGIEKSLWMGIEKSLWMGIEKSLWMGIEKRPMGSRTRAGAAGAPLRDKLPLA